MAEYNTADIRKFLIDSFSEQEVMDFCFDYFRDAYEEFAEAMPKTEKVQRLIESCTRREALPSLAAALRKERPAQFEVRFGKPAAEVGPEVAARQRDPRQVFISYAYEDTRFAHRLAADLEERGWRAWIAPDSIRPGEKWAEAINRGLEECGVFVVALTPNSVHSSWVVTETNVAIELQHKGRIRFLPVLVENCNVPALWAAYQSIAFREDYLNGLTALVTELERPLAAPSGEAAPGEEAPRRISGGQSLIRRVPVWAWVGIAAVLLLGGVFLGRWAWNQMARRSPASTTPIALVAAPIPMPLMTPAISVAAKDGMELVYVPAGKFPMGSTADDVNARDDEKPAHLVDVDAFWIDRTEVTNAMFAKFVAVTGYKTRAEKIGKSTALVSSGKWEYVNGANWQHPTGPDSDLTGLEQHPVVHVTWDDADAYCQWAGRRLPTEAEWEKAARGTDGRLYPWGNSRPTDSLSNFDMNAGRSMPVRSYPDGMSPYGALDMSGNVWEWVADFHSETYYQISPPRNPQGPSSGVDRIMRGGSWYMNAAQIRAAYRGWDGQTDMNVHVGFRCARSA